MKISDDERTYFSQFRDVSDLRTQFQCEYRLYLKQTIGEKSTKASIEGIKLHSNFEHSNELEESQYQILPLVIIIMTILIGFLWIMW